MLTAALTIQADGRLFAGLTAAFLVVTLVVAPPIISYVDRRIDEFWERRAEGSRRKEKEAEYTV
jgi:hypothetical protein